MPRHHPVLLTITLLTALSCSHANLVPQSLRSKTQSASFICSCDFNTPRRDKKKNAQPADRITCRPHTCLGSGDVWPNRKSTEKMFKRLSFWHAPREVQWPRTYCIHWGLTGGIVAQGMKMQPSGGITNTSQMVLAAGTNCAAACRCNFFKFGYIIALRFSIAWSVQKYLGHVFEMDFQTLRFKWHHPLAIKNWKLHIWYQQITKWFSKHLNPQTKKRPLPSAVNTYLLHQTYINPLRIFCFFTCHLPLLSGTSTNLLVAIGVVHPNANGHGRTATPNGCHVFIIMVNEASKDFRWSDTILSKGYHITSRQPCNVITSNTPVANITFPNPLGICFDEVFFKFFGQYIPIYHAFNGSFHLSIVYPRVRILSAMPMPYLPTVT